MAGIYLRGVSEGAISDNAISSVGINSPLAAAIAGVRVESSLDVRISDNSITNIAPAATFVNPAAGILVLGPIVNLEIADNLIRRQITPNDADFSPWGAIRVLGIAKGPTLGGSQLETFDNFTAAARVNTIGTFAAVTPVNQQTGITSNSLHGYGRGPLVEVSVTGSCRFNDNQCTVAGEQITTAINLAASSIIVSANRVECSAKRAAAIALTLGNEKNLFTALGNIVSGSITVNGGPLAPPWEPLNVLYA